MSLLNIKNLLTHIASKGNNIDIINTLTLINAYDKTYTTGKVVMINHLRGGLRGAQVKNLEATFTLATSQVNALHTYNKIKEDFRSQVISYLPTFYTTLDSSLYSRIGLEKPTYPVTVNDCQGTLITTATNDATYIVALNSKSTSDYALCGSTASYGVLSGETGYLFLTPLEPDNTVIPFNATGVTQHAQLEAAQAERKALVDREARF